MSEEKQVIAVVGAGTAGSAAAIRLRQLGHEVVMIERSVTSGFRIGESIPGAILRPLQTLGFQSLSDLLSATDYRQCPALSSAWGDDDWYFKDGFMNPEGGGWQILRHRFDESLRQQALNLGCDVIVGNCEQVEKSAEGFLLHIRNEATQLIDTQKVKLIIDATGRNSNIIRKLGFSKERVHEQTAVYCWVRLPKDRMQASRVKTVKNGWWYTSLLPDDVRVVSFHGLPQDTRLLQRSPELFVNAFNAAGLIDEQLSVDDLTSNLHSSDASASLSNACFGANWVAVGDAALAFDPISAQGVFFALYSAIRGVEALVSVNELQKEAYASQVKQIAKINNNLRMRYYTSELRFTEEPYWAQYFV